MGEKLVFYLADRWAWAALFGLFIVIGLAMVAALLVQGPDASIAFPIACLVLWGFLGWLARRSRVEIHESSLLLKGLLSRAVELSDIRVVTEIRFGSFAQRNWLRLWRTIWLSPLPIGTGLALETTQSRGPPLLPLLGTAWIIFRIERQDEFLSILEARGVPVRRMGGGVEST